MGPVLKRICSSERQRRSLAGSSIKARTQPASLPNVRRVRLLSAGCPYGSQGGWTAGPLKDFCLGLFAH